MSKLSDAEILRIWATMPKHHGIIEFARAVVFADAAKLAAEVVPRAPVASGRRGHAATKQGQE